MRNHMEWMGLGWEKDHEAHVIQDHHAEVTAFLQRWPVHRLPLPFREPMRSLSQKMQKLEATLERVFLLDYTELVDLRMTQALAELRLEVLKLKQEAMNGLHAMGQKVFLNHLRKTLGTGDFAEAFRANEQRVTESEAVFAKKLSGVAANWGSRFTAERRARLMDTQMGPVVDLHLEMVRKLDVPARANELLEATALLMAMGKPSGELKEEYSRALGEIKKIATARCPHTHLLRAEIERRVGESGDSAQFEQDLRTVALFDLVEQRMNQHIQQRIEATRVLHHYLVMRCPEPLLAELLKIYRDGEGCEFDPDEDDAMATREAAEEEAKVQSLLAAFVAKYGSDFSPLTEDDLLRADAETMLGFHREVEAQYLALEKRYPGVPKTAFRR